MSISADEMRQSLLALQELRNSLWMLAVCLVAITVSIYSLNSLSPLYDFGDSDPATIADERPAIEEVSASECLGAKPDVGAICARSTDWWQPVDPDFCDGGDSCYQHADLLALEESLPPYIFGPGLIPLVFVIVVMWKIRKARRLLREFTQKHDLS